MNKRFEANLIYAFAYLIATLLACLSFRYAFETGSLLTDLFLADFVGAFTIYLGCILLNSFSLYDPYWSYQCNVISMYFLFKKWSYLDLRSILVFCLVNMWSIRLNSNLFLNGIDDKNYEDWRYSDFRQKFSKILGLLVGCLVFIILPTVLVFFGCCLPLYYVYQSNSNLNQLDLFATILTLIGIIFEGIADTQLRNNHIQNKNKRVVMNKGVWSLCRHPNYFGEITFWFGLLLFALATEIQFDKTLLIGPVGIFLIIYFGSLPMMEQRQLERRKEYKEYMKCVPFKLLPLNIFKYKTQ